MSLEEAAVTARFRGLCPECEERVIRSYLTRSGPPVANCPECERLRLEYQRRTGEDFSFDAPGEREPNASAGQAELVGLCVNCANRESCTFPRTQAGVWFCSEYC